MLASWKKHIPAPKVNTPVQPGNETQKKWPSKFAIIGAIIFSICFWRAMLLIASFVGAWAFVYWLTVRSKHSQALSHGAGFIAGIICVLIVSSLLNSGGNDYNGPTLGVSSSEMLGNGMRDSFAMEKDSDVDGMDRYTGKSESELAILELIGDSDDLTKVGLTIAMPRDAAALVRQNAEFALNFLQNIDPTWTKPAKNAWFADVIDRFNRGQSPTCGRRREWRMKWAI